MTDAIFDRDCRQCPRLASFLDDVGERYPDYYCKPVPPFGDVEASLLIVGLAPGMHGANRTGRPFTGDHAGILLYEMLHKFGFSTHQESLAADDDLQLTGHPRTSLSGRRSTPAINTWPTNYKGCRIRR